ncbi:MAG: FKBP-type peptidyl-prolyl cis-trans isomerase [Parafilimonas sp.]
MMKKIAILLFIAFTCITCNKKNDAGCVPVLPDSEAASMAAFCSAHGITCTVDTNGIYYQVIDPGSGVTPDINSVITVTYTTTTLDDQVIEDKTGTPVTLPLNQFIEGWRIAIPYIQKGGRIKMVIPSSLAYGCTGISGVIAPNAPLYFDVVLVDVQ